MDGLFWLVPTRLFLQEFVPGVLLFLPGFFLNEDVACLMPLSDLFGSAIVQGNLVGRWAIIAFGPGENRGFVGDTLVCNNQNFLTYLQHGTFLRSRTWLEVYSIWAMRYWPHTRAGR